MRRSNIFNNYIKTSLRGNYTTYMITKQNTLLPVGCSRNWGRVTLLWSCVVLTIRRGGGRRRQGGRASRLRTVQFILVPEQMERQQRKSNQSFRSQDQKGYI